MIILRKICRMVLCALICVLLVSSSFVLPSSAASVKNPYKLIDGGCVKSVDMHTNKRITGDISYFTANVSSHIQGEQTRAEIPYEVYGAIGSKETRMFVYSIGTEDDQDYTTHRVVDIAMQFERDNPAWDAVVATNGDFVDIEKVLTSSIGEPEGPMIQNGSVIKG